MVITAKVETDVNKKHKPIQIDFLNSKKLLTAEAVFDIELEDKSSLLCDFEYHSKREDIELSFENRKVDSDYSLRFSDDIIEYCDEYKRKFVMYVNGFGNYSISAIYCDGEQVGAVVRNNVKSLLRIYVPDEFLSYKDAILFLASVCEYNMYYDFIGVDFVNVNPYNKKTGTDSLEFSMLSAKWFKSNFKSDETCGMVVDMIYNAMGIKVTGKKTLIFLFILTILATIVSFVFSNTYGYAGALLIAIFSFLKFTGSLIRN